MDHGGVRGEIREALGMASEIFIRGADRPPAATAETLKDVIGFCRHRWPSLLGQQVVFQIIDDIAKLLQLERFAEHLVDLKIFVDSDIFR